MNYILGIDIGTSGTKTVLFNELLEIVASKTIEYELFQPHNGWAEQNPTDWVKATLESIKNVVNTSGVNGKNIKSIGLSGQMHGLVMLDKNNTVIRPAIIWADQRTDKECAEITKKVGAEKLIEITANPALTGFTASKILWVKNNEPENYKKCAHILLPKDYVRFVLTGEYATDVSDASGMQLLDVKNRKWSNEILNILEIDLSLLPKLYESPEKTGELTAEIAQELTLSPKTIVVAGAGDNAAAAVGTGVVTDGSAFTTIGTSGVVYAHSSKFFIDPMGRVHTFCCAVPNCWHVMGVTQAAGLSLKWFKDTLYDTLNKKTYKDIDTEVQNIAIGSEKLIYLPYLMGERTPHLDPYARGVFFGLSAKHTKEHLARAVIEGISFSLKDCYDILTTMGITVNSMMLTGGGAKSELWQHMLADMFNCTIQTLEQQEGAARGAAILAGVGAKIFSTVEDTCKKYIKKGSEYTPNYNNHTMYQKYYVLYKKLYTQLKQSFAEINAIKA